MAAVQARIDIREKLSFEKKLLRKINGLNRRIVKAVVKEYLKNNRVLLAEIFREEIEEMLNKHYKQVSKQFAKRLTQKMPNNLATTIEERKTIDDALNIYFLATAGDQAHLITKTNQKNIESALAEAQQQDEQEQLAKSFHPNDIAAILALNLVRKFNGRKSTIASFETQLPAEVSKLVEAQVLLGLPPSVTVGTTRKANVQKEWVTMGDERVRPAHIAADSQLRDINENYNVGGEQLMFPRDTSQGASAGNVINCRCASIVDESAFIDERSKLINS